LPFGPVRSPMKREGQTALVWPHPTPGYGRVGKAIRVEAESSGSGESDT